MTKEQETQPEMDGQNNGKSFSKGNLPSWFSVILLAVIAYMGKGTMEEFREAKSLGISTDKRVTVLEQQSKSFQDSLTDLRFSVKDVLNEVKSVNTRLEQQQKRQ